MVLDYKNFTFSTEKNKILNSTTPCETCISAACLYSKATFLDWIDNSDKSGELYFRGEKECRNIHFKNFPNLHIEGNDINNCTFENCQEITIYKSKVMASCFKNVSEINGHYSSFNDCTFSQCCSQGPLLSINGSGEVSGCSFDNNIALTEDGYILYMIFDSAKDITGIKDCSFAFNTVENPGGEIVHSEYLEVVTTTKSLVTNNIDYETCDFGEGKAIEIGSFDLDVPEGDYDGIEIIGSFVSEEY